MVKETTKEKITRTAYALFKKQGFSQVKVTDICDACHITKPAFYYHFSSKESLLENFYAGVIEKIQTQSIDFVLADNVWQQLLMVFDELMKAGNELGVDLNSQLFVMNLKQDRGTFNFSRPLRNLCIALINKAQQQGQIRNTSDPEALFHSAAFMSTGYEVFWCIKEGKFNRQALFQQSLEALFDVAPELRISDKEQVQKEVQQFCD